MMDDPKVSVIIPCYNCRATLPRAIESVLAQTYSNVELVVVDDASTEDISEIVDEYRRVSYVRLEQNSGPAVARNTGVARSSGDLIAFLDADDEWLPEHLGRQVTWMRRFPEAGFSFCNALNRDTAGRSTNQFSRSRRAIALLDQQVVGDGVYLVRNNLASAILLTNFIFTPSVVAWRSFWDDVGGFDVRLWGPEDIHLWVRMARHSEALMITDIGVIRHTLPTGLTLQGERWLVEVLKALDLIQLEVRDDPLALRSLEQRRRGTYIGLLLVHGAAGQRGKVWEVFRAAWAHRVVDYRVWLSFLAALGGPITTKGWQGFRRWVKELRG
jgi:glycosyltransferase involved in cell wall biosynthesis